MVKHRLIVSAVALVLAGGSAVRASDSTDRSVSALARDYRELRAKRQQQPPGVRIKELDDSGGRLEQTLSALGVALGHPPHTSKEIVKAWARPMPFDAIGRWLLIWEFMKESGENLRPASNPGATGDLIYHWRGGHDFLVFHQRRRPDCGSRLVVRV